MPNTLCHIGFQAPLNGLILKKNELGWVIIACIIPDIPWIVLKALIGLDLFSPYDLRLYCTAQASLFFCLIFSLAIASFTPQRIRVFLILGSNCLFHLLLDALQIKWGNGVHLLSPLSWEMFHLDLAWPEHFLILGFTVLGFLYLIKNWKGYLKNGIQLQLSQPWRNTAGILLLAIYLAGPFVFLDKMEQLDTYYIRTMRHKELRTGKIIEFDRVHYYAEKNKIKTFYGELIAVIGDQPETSGRVSFRGRFTSPTVISVESYHYHKDFRDLASILGLFMACTLLLQSLILARIAPRKIQ